MKLLTISIFAFIVLDYICLNLDIIIIRKFLIHTFFGYLNQQKQNLKKMPQLDHPFFACSIICRLNLTVFAPPPYV